MHFYCLHSHRYQRVHWTFGHPHHWANSSCSWDIQDTFPLPTCMLQLSNSLSPCLTWYLPPCHIDKNPWQAISPPTQSTWVQTYCQSDGGTLPLGSQQRPSCAPPGSSPLSTIQWCSLQDSSGCTAGLPHHCSWCNYSQTWGSMCQQHLYLQGMVDLYDCPQHHSRPICGLHWWCLLCRLRWP